MRHFSSPVTCVAFVTFLGIVSTAAGARAQKIVIGIADYEADGGSAPINFPDGAKGSATIEIGLGTAIDDGAGAVSTDGVEATLKGLGPSVIPAFRMVRPAEARIRTSADGTRVIELSAEVVVETPDGTRSITYDVLAVGELPDDGANSKAVDLLIEGTRRDAPATVGSDGPTKSPSFSGMARGVVDVEN